MIDEAFMPFQQVLEEMLAFDGEFIDDEAGVRSYISRYEIESPVELDVVRDENGGLRIGSIPPLYRVDTSFRPSFHKLRFTAEISRETNGD